MIKVAVASSNPVKIQATKSAFLEYYKQVEIVEIKIDLNIPKQPIGIETFKGAETRAMYLFTSENKCDFYVGIEGGTIELYNNWFSFGVSCIIDRIGKKSFGTSILFPLPEKIVKEIKKGSELGEIIDKYEGKKDTKKEGGAISFLTNGLLKREQIYKEAVIASLIPFIKKELF